MRTFSYVEPDPNEDGDTYIETIVSEEEIIRDYYPIWKDNMDRIGRSALATVENCIDDFVTVHWATEIKGN